MPSPLSIWLWAVLVLLAGLAGCQPDETMPPATDAPGTPVDMPATPAYRLRLIGTQVVPSGATVNFPRRDTTVRLPIGGLSGLDYAPGDSTWYVISDGSEQAVPPRFFTFKLDFNRRAFRKATVTGAVLLRTPENATFAKNAADAESIRYNPDTNTLYWLNEGQQSEKISPFLYEMNLDGSFIRKVQIPKMFRFTKSDTTGLRRNRAMEGMALSPDRNTIWVASEEPLRQDGPSPKPDSSTLSPIRLSKIDLQTGELDAQYPYMLGSVPARPVLSGDTAVNGVSEILVLPDGTLIVVERAFVLGPGFFTRVYAVETATATDVSDIDALAGAKYTPVTKSLLVEFSSLAGVGPLDLNNTEGVALGPTLDNGNPSLVFVTDNNFNPFLSSQFFAFELQPTESGGTALGR